jgi:hypothetical protein
MARAREHILPAAGSTSKVRTEHVDWPKPDANLKDPPNLGQKAASPTGTKLIRRGVQTEEPPALPERLSSCTVERHGDRSRHVVVRAIAKNGSPVDTAVDQVMCGNVYYCFEGGEVDRVACFMAQYQVRRLVLNRSDHRARMVVLADLGRCNHRVSKVASEGASQPGDASRRRHHSRVCRRSPA